MADMQASGARMESLLSATERESAAARSSQRGSGRERLSGWAQSVLARRGVRRGLLAGVATIAVAGGAAAVWAVLPRATPDYALDPIDDVFDYTLLTADFNSLPLDKRAELLRDLVARMKNAEVGDSVLLSAFAAGIDAAARKQIEQNASRFMLDLVDKQALQYANVPAAERGKVIEAALVEMVHTFQTIAGEAPESPQKIVDDAKQNAQRDEKRWAEQSNERKATAAARMFDFMNNRVAGNSTPQQKARLTSFMRDMGRHLRGGK